MLKIAGLSGLPRLRRWFPFHFQKRGQAMNMGRGIAADAGASQNVSITDT